MSYAELLMQDRRLVYLRFLAAAPGYESNESILQSAVAEYSHHVSRDVVRTDLAWLEEQALLTTRTIGDVVIAKITMRGEDVAAGRTRVPGVKRPSPRDQS